MRGVFRFFLTLLLLASLFSCADGFASYAIGDQGPAGLVFYDKGSYTDGWRYLEAAYMDEGSLNTTLAQHQWYNGDYLSISTDIGIGSGEPNTKAIALALGEGDYAAALCEAKKTNGYSDWFLPSKDELNLMYTNLKAKGLGAFRGAWYWSSSQFNSGTAWGQNFNDGEQGNFDTSYINRVRAVRAF